MKVSWISTTLLPAPSAEALAAYPPGPWPVCVHTQYPALPLAVACARQHATELLGEWRLDDHAEAVQLVVSELVTNAVRAYPGDTRGVPYVRLWLCTDLQRVLVQVWDATEVMPVLQDPGPYATHSRGLMIVDSVSKDWNYYRPAALPGKVVWSLLA